MVNKIISRKNKKRKINRRLSKKYNLLGGSEQQAANNKKYKNTLYAVWPSGPEDLRRPNTNQIWNFEENMGGGACFYYALLRGLERSVINNNYQFPGKPVGYGFNGRKLSNDKLTGNNYRGNEFNVNIRQKEIEELRRMLNVNPQFNIGREDHLKYTTWAEDTQIQVAANYFDTCICIWVDSGPSNKTWNMFIPGFEIPISINYELVNTLKYSYESDFEKQGSMGIFIGYELRDRNDQQLAKIENNTLSRDEATELLAHKYAIQISESPDYIEASKQSIIDSINRFDYFVRKLERVELDPRAGKVKSGNNLRRIKNDLQQTTDEVLANIALANSRCKNIVFMYNIPRNHYYYIEKKNLGNIEIDNILDILQKLKLQLSELQDETIFKQYKNDAFIRPLQIAYESNKDKLSIINDFFKTYPNLTINQFRSILDRLINEQTQQTPQHNNMCRLAPEPAPSQVPALAPAALVAPAAPAASKQSPRQTYKTRNLLALLKEKKSNKLYHSQTLIPSQTPQHNNTSILLPHKQLPLGPSLSHPPLASSNPYSLPQPLASSMLKPLGPSLSHPPLASSNPYSLQQPLASPMLNPLGPSVLSKSLAPRVSSPGSKNSSSTKKSSKKGNKNSSSTKKSSKKGNKNSSSTKKSTTKGNKNSSSTNNSWEIVDINNI